MCLVTKTHAEGLTILPPAMQPKAGYMAKAYTVDKELKAPRSCWD